MREALRSPATWLPAGVIVLFFLPALVDLDGALWSPDSDFTAQYLPYLDHLANGASPPSRNPVPFAGIAATGNLNAPIAYPPVAIYLAWPKAWWLTAILVGHLVLLAAGMSRLARSIGLSPAAGAFAGIAVALSARMFGHVWAGHVFLIMAFAWVPWILHLARRLPHRPSRVVPLALAFGLCFSTGFVQVGYLAVVAALLTALAAARGADGAPRLRRVVSPFVALAAAGLGAVAAAATLLPGALAAAESARAGGLDPGFASVFSIGWADLPGLALPLHLGHPAEGNFWAGLNYWERCVYPGAAVGVLGLIGLATPGDRRRWWLLAGAALALLFALGDRTPVFPVLFRALPWLDRFRVPGRTVLFALPALALIAARGFDTVLLSVGGERPRLARWVLPALAVLLLAATAVWSLSRGGLVEWGAGRPGTTVARAATAVVAVQRSLVFASVMWLILVFLVRFRVTVGLAWRGLATALLAVTIAEAWVTGGRFVRARPVETLRASTEVSEAVRRAWPDGRVLDRAGALSPATAQWRGIELAGGCDPMTPARYVRWFDLVADLPEGAPDTRIRAETRLFDSSWRVELLPALDMAGMLTRETIADPRFSRVDEVRDADGNTVFLYGFGDARWRAKVRGTWHRVDGPKEAFASLKETPEDVVEGGPPPPDQPRPGSASVEVRETDLYVIDVETASDSMLFVSESYSAAWRATVDGRPAEVLPGNLAFLAVPLPSGARRVVLSAVRPGFEMGILLSLVTASVLLMTMAALARRSRKTPPAGLSSHRN